MAPSREVGTSAEHCAEKFLRKNGLKLIERNFSASGGEIDLIMLDGATLVFVEVRFRKHEHFGRAEETVDFRKQQRIIHTAKRYLQTHPNAQQSPCRFDVVTFTTEVTSSKLEWIKNAFLVEE